MKLLITILVILSPVVVLAQTQTNGARDYVEMAAPGNPPSGYDRLYMNATTHQLTCLTATGTSCAAAGTSTTTEICHNNTPGTAGNSGAPYALIQCTQLATLVVGGHYRVVAGVQLSTSAGSPTASTLRVGQGIGGNVLCDMNPGANPVQTNTYQGQLECEFTITDATHSLSYGGAILLDSTANTLVKGMSPVAGLANTADTTQPVTVFVAVFGALSNWQGMNLAVYRLY